jgi:hypothetical protein
MDYLGGLQEATNSTLHNKAVLKDKVARGIRMMRSINDDITVLSLPLPAFPPRIP